MEARVKELLIELRSISEPEVKRKKQAGFGISSDSALIVFTERNRNQMFL